MTTTQLIEALKDGRLNQYETQAIIRKLRAGEKLAKHALAYRMGDLHPVILEQAIENYNRAGGGDETLFD